MDIEHCNTTVMTIWFVSCEPSNTHYVNTPTVVILCNTIPTIQFFTHFLQSKVNHLLLQHNIIQNQCFLDCYFAAFCLSTQKTSHLPSNQFIWVLLDCCSILCCWKLPSSFCWLPQACLLSRQVLLPGKICHSFFIIEWGHKTVDLSKKILVDCCVWLNCVWMVKICFMWLWLVVVLMHFLQASFAQLLFNSLLLKVFKCFCWLPWACLLSR